MDPSVCPLGPSSGAMMHHAAGLRSNQKNATLPGVQVIAERASIGVAQVVQQLLQEA